MKTHILILRPGAIGDALLTFPLLRAMKMRNEQTHITFVSNSAVLPLATRFGLADAVFDYGAIEWSELFSQSGIRSPLLQKIAQGTSRAICWLQDPDGVVQHNLRYAGIQDVTIAPGRPSPTSELHIITYMASTIGMTLSEQERSQAFSSGPNNDAQSVAIHPGSGGSFKCWPIEHFTRVIQALWQQNIPVLLLAGPADTERLVTLQQHIGTPSTPSLLKMLNNASLVEVAEHLQRCKAYLGNDSGITHLAAMLGIPTVALFGPSNPNIWRPLGPHVQVIYKPDMKDLQVSVVFDTVMGVMNYPYGRSIRAM